MLKQLKMRIHKKITQNYHSSLDSANKKCYTITRTKEERKRDRGSMKRTDWDLLPGFRKIKKQTTRSADQIGGLTYVYT